VTEACTTRSKTHTQAHRAGGESILIVMQRLTPLLILILAFVAALSLSGLNVGTARAGLGIGGLAIALAAQKSLENLIGGVSLLMDKAVHVGSLCKISNQVGTVEDIGLRGSLLSN
jgi:MscS family membrane protein